VQRSPAGCMYVCDIKTSTMRRSGPSLGCCPTAQKKDDGTCNIFREISASKCYQKRTGLYNIIAKTVFKCGSDV
jgi:hypothetical protein